MKKFNTWYIIKENDSSKEVDTLFRNASEKVKDVFDNLHILMQQTWGKKAPSWDTQLRDKTVNDLQTIVNRLKGDIGIKKESFYITNRLIKECILLNEDVKLAPWVQSIIGKSRNITVDRMLTAMQAEIMKIMVDLKDGIILHKIKNVESGVGDIGKKVSRTVGKNIRKVGGDIQQQISTGVKLRPSVTGDDRETARHLLVKLYKILKLVPGIKLYSGIEKTRALKFNPSNEREMAGILDKLSINKSFRVRIGTKDYNFDITNEGDTERVIELIKTYGGIDDF